ncbi:hypothetical protein [Amycolatopsis circi]|uniref:hypothetical protein n=1 Tax=Amycolatopsis circi TaxID=871959 RepID=UPI000E285603|nr:hypothetical protein [Amycolatopsis circi]
MFAERMNADDQAAPAADVVYDLDFPGPHKQWVAAIENSPTTPVWLGHRTDSGDRAALVATLPRGAFASGAAPLEWGAPGMALGKLMNSIEPTEPGADRAALGRAVQAHLAERVAAMSSWPRSTWTVDGVRVQAAVLHFAGAWLALTDELDLVYLAAVGVGISPDGLVFHTTRGEKYGADFSVPLTIGQLNRLRAEQMPQPSRPHPDLLRFR